MPNHVLNVLVIHGAQAGRVLSNLLNEAGELDFGRVVPMPAELDVSDESYAQILHQVLYGDWRQCAGYPWVPGEAGTSRGRLARFMLERFGRETAALAGRYELNRRRHGAKTWYDWRIAHWGCKWNAYGTRVLTREETRARVLFMTPWSPPLDVVEALAAQTPSLALELAYFDEYLNFCGYARLERGALVHEVDGVDDWVRRFTDIPEVQAVFGMEVDACSTPPVERTLH